MQNAKLFLFFFLLTIGQHICNPSLNTSLLQLSKYFVYKSHWGVKTIKSPTWSCGHTDFRTLKHTSRLRNDPNTYWNFFFKEERGTNDHKASLKTVRKCVKIYSFFIQHANFHTFSPVLVMMEIALGTTRAVFFFFKNWIVDICIWTWTTTTTTQHYKILTLCRILK